MFARASHNLSKWLLRAGAVSAMLATLSNPIAAHDFKAGPLQIEHPWSRATVPAAKVAGGYFTVVNPTGEADRLVSATADIAEKTELHQMSMVDGVMTMRPVDGPVEVPANGKLELQPGGQGMGYHLMFMNLKRPIVSGEKFAGTITFEKAGTVPVEFAVEGVGSTGGEDHSGHGK